MRSAAAKLQAARLAAETTEPRAMHVSDEGSPSAEASEDVNSDASGAELLATDAAHGGGGTAASFVRHGFAHWLLSLIPSRRR